jgi:hypothetical protein
VTTLGKLKAEIALEIARDDLAVQTSNAVASAIRHYRRMRFYFNVSDSIEFPTVEDQSSYDKTDLAGLANIISIDNVFLVQDTSTCELKREQPAAIELALPGNVTSDIPGSYAYENQRLRLAPPPDSAGYVIRIFGEIWIDPPAADDEADNPWMIEAYELIKYRAKASIYADYMEDLQMAGAMSAAEQEQLRTLEGETNMRSMTGFIEPTEF